VGLLVCRVALALGKHLHEVEGLPLGELRRWAAYDQAEGLPDPWMQAGVVASLLYNANRGKGQPALSPADFTPGRRGKAPAAATGTVEANMAALGGFRAPQE